MRVSSNVTYNDFIKNLGTNASKVQKTLNQISSLKEVSKSSDNPLLVSKIMNLNVAIARNETFGQEIKDSQDWINTQFGALQHVNDSMNNIRRLVQHSANGTQDVDEIKANRNEIQQEILGIVESLNTNFDGRYIFGGTNTTEPPFSVVRDANDAVIGIEYNGSTTEVSREIADSVVVDLPTNGEKIVGGSEMNDFLNGLIEDMDFYINNKERLSGIDRDSLDPDDPANADTLAELDRLDGWAQGMSSKIGDLDKRKGDIAEFQTRIDTIANRLKSAGARNETEKLSLKSTLSDRQDVDVAEKYMEYQNQMLAYQTTMAMGTKIMQTSILDYVR
ncbi:flagellar hook-associated protein FlgL [Enterococcus olivae]